MVSYVYMLRVRIIVLRISQDVLVQNKCVLQKISLIAGHDSKLRCSYGTMLISEVGCRLRRAFWSGGAPPPPPGEIYGGGVKEKGNDVSFNVEFFKMN